MSEQLGLFGQPPEPAGGSRRRRALEPAVVDAATRALAASLPRRVRLGTSSWSFPGWEGLVWARGERPPAQARLAREGLAVYARHPLLRAVGVDRTFYGPVPEETFGRWASEVPEDFRFLVKAPRSVLEPRTFDGAVNPTFLDPEHLHEELLGPADRGLGPRLGVVLLQVPPLPLRSPRDADEAIDRLAGFFLEVRRRTSVPVAVELRNRTLLEEDRLRRYREGLRHAAMGHCHAVHPSMPPVERQWTLLPPEPDVPGPVCVRWMLHAGQSYESARQRYAPFDRLVDADPASRGAIAEITRASAGREVLIIANNKAEGSSPLTLARLAEAIAEVGT
jgi:uncharacterized protein YecE (DUF72 family)